MQLSALMLLVFGLTLSARTVSQTVTFTGRDIPLERVFATVEKQTGYLVVYDKQNIRKAKGVSVTAAGQPLEDFMALILKGLPYEFSIEGKTIFIKNGSLPLSVLPEDKFLPVTGTIRNTEGLPLAGATIRVKGKPISTITSELGSFSLVAQEGDILVVSYIGYKPRELKVNYSSFNIILERQEMIIDTVAVTVNTGYQNIPKERATGSYTVISGKQFEGKLKPDLKAALEGQVAGMALTKEGNLEIRGISTFSQNLETRAPLLVIDGFPVTGGLETINVDNIESVTVLKDAVAASIYGARSSNGVIVVTTKQGRKGSLQFGYSGVAGLAMKPDLNYLNRTSSSDFVDLEVEMYNANPNQYLTTYNNYSPLSRVSYLLVAKSLGLVDAASVDKELLQLKASNGQDQLQKYYFRNQITQQHNISVSGGSDKNLVAASAKYITNKNNTLYNSDNRLILDVKNEWKPSRAVSVRLLSNVNYSTTKLPVRNTNELLTFYSNSSNLRPYDLIADPATGEPQNIFSANPKKVSRYAALPGLKPLNYNPLVDLSMEMTNTQNLQLRAGGSVNVLLVHGLNVEAGGVWTRGSYSSRSVYSKNAYRMRLAYDDNTSVSNPAKHYMPDGDMVVETRNTNESYSLRGQLNFNRTYGKHGIIAIAGMEIIRDIFDNNSYPTRLGYNDIAGTFATFNYADYNAGLYNADMLGTSKPQSPLGIGALSLRDNRYSSWYSNASYQYDNRFLVSSSVRVDQTNFFGTNPKYRRKPIWSVGGTYKISNEKYFAVSWINKLYVRGSYGINGAISLENGPFLIIAPGSFSNLTGDISYTITSAPNNSLRWEKTATRNLGTDISFFNSRLNMTLDYYLRKTTDALASDAIDPTLGYASLPKNAGRINNTGIELALDGDVVRRKNFSWNLRGVMGYNDNKVIEYNVNYAFASSLAGTSVNRAGYAANALFSYRNGGLDNNGNVLFLNAAGTPISTGAAAVGDVVYSGTTRAKYNYSITNTFRYRSFDFAFMLLARTGAVLRRSGYDGGRYQNKDVALRWRKAGDEKTTVYPRFDPNSLDQFYFPNSELFVESANYLKLRDASIAWHINKNWLSKIRINDATLTFQGRNLLLWTANKSGVDPEAVEVNSSSSSLTQAELGFTPFRPRPEFYLGLRVNF